MGYYIAAMVLIVVYINGRLDQSKADRDGESHFYLFLTFLCVLGGTLMLGGK